MKIIQIHENDGGGGAGLSAYQLMDALCKRGIDSELYVGRTRLSNDSRVKYLSKRYEKVVNLSRIFPFPEKVQSAIRIILNLVSAPKFIVYCLTGKEYSKIFNSEHDLKKLLMQNPDIVHCHNLHSHYFDLSSLIYLSHHVPVILTLRDTWLLSGHCAYYLDCMKWRTGCGSCPDLSIYPAIRKDATAFNWSKRAEIFSKCKFYITGPSKWVVDSASQSMLNTGVIQASVIPNGINLDIFHPGDKIVARSALSLPLDKFILIYSASGLKTNRFKDYSALMRTLENLGKSNAEIFCIALGDSSEDQIIGNAITLHFVPFISDMEIVSLYYQAADVYIHPAKAETFGRSIAEAEACGLPVIAFAVCGIPELIVDGENGYLVAGGDADAMSAKIISLFENPALREKMGEKSAALAKERYGIELMVNRYISLYQSILSNEENNK